MTRKKRRSTRTVTKLQYDDREEQILGIATALFELKGYDRASLKNIADKTGIETASLYYYFSSKEDLYVKVMDRSLRLLADNVKQAIETVGDPWEKLKQAAIAHSECMLSRTVVQVAFHPRFPLGISDKSLQALKRQRRDYERVIGSIVDMIDLKEGIDKKLFLYFFLSSMNYSGLWYKPEGRLKPAQIAAGVIDILKGCAADTV